MDKLEILKQLVKFAKEGDECGIKPDLTSSEIEAIQWAVARLDSKNKNTIK